MLAGGGGGGVTCSFKFYQLRLGNTELTREQRFNFCTRN